MKSNANAIFEKREREKFIEDLVASVKEDFLLRQKERLFYERNWELNLNFLSGNQYTDVGARGDIVEEDKTYYWQSKFVYNHIAPIIETRLAKFSKVNPIIASRPKSDDDKDTSDAKKAEKLIEEAFLKNKISDVVRRVTSWSETCGTGFYKVIWNQNKGSLIGEIEDKKVFEGDVEIIAVSPFEIFPDNLHAEKISDLKSIIHAKAMDVSEIKRRYGVSLAGGEVDVFNLGVNASALKKSNKTVVKNAQIVIEKYERESEEFPNGRIITIAGDKLLYYGELPYINPKTNKREFPFVKQESSVLPGSFFGKSIIERLIPVQRAFNAVKNRKHEFLNRLSMGILTVEDGSIDVGDLEGDGLEPGKILVYRQGSTPPEMMERADMPSSFNEEEEKLLNEFVIISGVSDVVSSSENSKVSSGTALEILVEQDNERLTFVAERIRESYLEIARQILWLYSSYIGGVKMIKSTSRTGRVKIYYVDKNVALSDDLFIENQNELRFSEAQKKDMIFKLYESGLLEDKDGNIEPVLKEKILALLGYKGLLNDGGISLLQEDKAIKENQKLKTNELDVDLIDDDNIHIIEHKRYLLSELDELSDKEKQRFYNHIQKHILKANTAKSGEYIKED